MGNEKPLVSFCVKCYNQKHLIGDALRGAFAQTYSPLEIVISDDASTDGSQELIESLIVKYRKDGGRHHVVFVKNEKNLGNLGNWQKLCEVAKGELLIQADGDDVSCPSRASEIVDAWLKTEKKAVAVANHAVAFMADGVICGFLRRTGGGAITAYSKKALACFGLVNCTLAKGAGDDAIFMRRAEMIGQSACVPKILTCYRWGSGATTGARGGVGRYRRRVIKGGLRSELAAMRQLLVDVESVRGLIGNKKADSLANSYRVQLYYYQKCLILWESGCFCERCKMFKELYLFKERLSLQTIGLVLCLPRFVGDFVLDGVFGLAEKFKKMKYRSFPKLRFDDMEKLDTVCKSF